MMKITPPGTLYLIGEHDHDGQPTDLYKIGIVRNNDKRSTIDRLTEHQTGNPRELALVFSGDAPLIERVETVLHGEHSTCRLGGEWFHLPGDKIHRATSQAERRLSEARSVAPAADCAAELSTMISDGATRSATSNDIELHRELVSARQHRDLSKSTSRELVKAILAAQKRTQAENRWIREEPKNGATKLDQQALAAAHPRIFQRYLITKPTQSRRFRLHGFDAAKVTIIAELTELINESSALLGVCTDPEELHSQYLKLHEEQTRFQWLYERLEVQLRATCGLNEAIDGVCTWSRRIELKETLDTETLRQDKPELYERFLTRSPDSIALIPAKDLAYRARPLPSA